MGVVVGTTESLIQPVVHIFYDKKKEREVSIPDLDLSRIGDQVVGYGDSSSFDLRRLEVFKDVAADLFPTAA